MYELLHGVRPWKDWTRLQQAGQAVQQAAAGEAAAANANGANGKDANGQPQPLAEEKNSEKVSDSQKDSALRNMRQIHISSKLDPVTADFLSRILCVDKKKRLGCGPGGWDEVKSHSWFKDVDWDKLARKEVQPPITPDLTRANCTADADLADQLLDRKPREIAPDQQQHFRGWKFRTELTPQQKQENGHANNNTQTSQPPTSRQATTQVKQNGLIVAERPGNNEGGKSHS